MPEYATVDAVAAHAAHLNSRLDGAEMSWIRAAASTLLALPAPHQEGEGPHPLTGGEVYTLARNAHEAVFEDVGCSLAVLSRIFRDRVKAVNATVETDRKTLTYADGSTRRRFWAGNDYSLSGWAG